MPPLQFDRPKIRNGGVHPVSPPSVLAPPAGTAFLASSAPEISVVIPCLNEAETVGGCIEAAARALVAHGIQGEIVVADNGSTDGSQAIAERAGARVVYVAARGYGNALQGGIAAARAPFVLMGDADQSYDFGELPRFLAALREGADLVQGCRLPAGGGRVERGAMPFLHRWLGNPFFSLLARRWFRAPIHDVYCGMRAFRRTRYAELELAAPGMEFAIEMIVRAARAKHAIREVPITLHRDGRTAHRGHLRTFRDGWRTLGYFVAERFGAR